MQVIELAEDLRVDAEGLIALLRKMGIPVADEDATITDGQMAKVLAKVERERRSGPKDPAAAIRAALEDGASTTTRRRRRAKATIPEPEPEQDAEVEAEVEESEDTPDQEAEAEADPAIQEAEADPTSVATEEVRGMVTRRGASRPSATSSALRRR